MGNATILCRKKVDHTFFVHANILFSPPSDLSNLLLYGSSKFDEENNAAILRSTIKFIHDSSRFKKLEAYPDPD